MKDYEILHTNNNVDCCTLNTWFGHGVIRKRWKMWEESELNAMNEEQHEHAERQNESDPFEWEGQEQIRETSFKIGMVLDLDNGTLDVYTNDRRLGTMKNGLVGEYCWVISMPFDGGVSVSIGR